MAIGSHEIITTESMCVDVFSRVTASISHEIKNVLAIINENAGLLDDLTMICPPEQGVPAERIKNITETIARQVKRANVIMKNMNRLAHLGDTPRRREPLGEVLLLVAALADRQAAMKNISVHVNCAEEMHLTAPMLPFFSLLYLSLQKMVKQSPHESEITIHSSAGNNELNVTIQSSSALEDITALIPGDDAGPILHSLGAAMDASGSMILLRLPRTVDNE